jgi:Family of unknown function (DUF5670)
MFLLGTTLAQASSEPCDAVAVSSRCAVDREVGMLWTIAVILLLAWLVGVVSANTLGGLIHLLLVVAIAVVLLNVIQGRRAV